MREWQDSYWQALAAALAALKLEWRFRREDFLLTAAKAALKSSESDNPGSPLLAAV